MSLVSQLSRQHQEIEAIAARLDSSLDVDSLRSDPTRARQLLSQLTGKLQHHLALEDRQMYPHLLGSDDLTARSTAERFQLEMGGLADEFADYLSEWPNVAAIAADADRFVTETRTVLRALSERIVRENVELYPLAP